ncbi:MULTISPECIES: hypothetical protein [unclassified Streptomyces]|uniref:hypothetical protein n=1 Tax=unclassified Streptomyces TaxID=2593676 RepID=UPI002E2D2876|nr:hypothetical protein [Streptomyces sp. NBC_01423]WSX91574.1 hypothetical protein OH827_13975 [Streptomyces sp. NBC_00891]WSY06052.1 hypothetical protein OG464_13975 [Streptomyces sp. NBC_00890]WSZ07676.1 hypothetical protein OG704_13975 [Streptomyces sp. NBC_00869]WSZ24825.1 hypothetical protein OG498_19590 [Streptomyces sp. NBC_00870]
MGKDLKVITDAIRADVGMWDEQAKSIGEVSASIKGMHRSPTQLGLFAPLFTAYNGVIDHLSSRCGEGQVEMSKIADELIRNAKAYDDHEVETTESVKGAY